MPPPRSRARCHTCRYACCALTLCLPVAAAKAIAPLVTTAAKRLPKAINNACLAVEWRLQRHLGPPREALAPFLAAAGRVRSCANFLFLRGVLNQCVRCCTEAMQLLLYCHISCMKYCFQILDSKPVFSLGASCSIFTFLVEHQNVLGRHTDRIHMYAYHLSRSSTSPTQLEN